MTKQSICMRLQARAGRVGGGCVEAAEARAIELARPALHRDGDAAIGIEHAAGALAGGRHAPLRLGGIAVGADLNFERPARAAAARCRRSAGRFRRQARRPGVGPARVPAFDLLRPAPAALKAAAGARLCAT